MSRSILRSASALVLLVSLTLVEARAADAPPEGWIVARSPITGLLSFLGGPDRGSIPLPRSPEDPLAIVRSHGSLFGVTDPARELILLDSSICVLGDLHHRYQQVHRGIPVFTGQLIVHQHPDGTFTALNGDFYPISEDVPIESSLAGEDAEFLAVRELGWAMGGATQAELVFVDPRWYGDPPAGIHLAWHLVITAPGRAEHVLVDAIGGMLLDHWPAMHSAIDRLLYDGTGGGIPGTLVRSEGDAATGDTDVDAVYDWAGDVYRLFFDGYGRDSIDGSGESLRSTVHWDHAICPNAVWNGARTLFCDGLAHDDVVAHEFTHGLTNRTANLIYQNQPGQLNESFSDIFGELVDLWNGDAILPGPPGGTPSWPSNPTGGGADVPNDARIGCGEASLRWKVAEGSSLGVIRDMWQPDCNGHPPSTVDPLYQQTTCNPNSDNGGVHRGSGVQNHAFAMLVDGKSYDGVTVTGIGAIKAGAIYFRTLTLYLTPASFFADAEPLLLQAASDLIGFDPNDPRTGVPSGSAISVSDTDQVGFALDAVHFSAPGLCGVGPPPPNDDCSGATVVGPGSHPFDSTSATDSSAPYPVGVCSGTSLGVIANDVWFSLTPPVDGEVDFSTCGLATFDSDLVVYTGPCGNLNPVACDGDTPGCATDTSRVLDFPVTGGVTYRVRIGSWEALVGWPGELLIDYTPFFEVCDNGLDDDADSLVDCDDPDCSAALVCQPWPADECASAAAAFLGANAIDTTGATDSPEPILPAGCAGTELGAMAKDVWYEFTPNGPGILTVSTCDGAGFDTDLAIYTGSCGALTQIACNGDTQGCAVSTSIIDLPVAAGIALTIRVGGRTSADAGTGTMSISLFLPPEVCANLIDDDFDGFTDCDDSDCANDPFCVCEPLSALTCAQGFAYSVPLGWTGGEIYDSIVIRRDTQVLATLAGDAESFLDPSVAPGSHVYRVTGVCPTSIVEISCTVAVVVPVTFTLIAPNETIDFDGFTGEASFAVELAIAESPTAIGYPNDTQGFSFGIAHDPSLLTAIASAPIGAVAALGGGAGPEFYDDQQFPGGTALSVVYDLSVVETIAFASVTPVIAIDYETVPTALAGSATDVNTDLVWTAGIGTPPVSNVIIVSGVTFGALTDDGTITLHPVLAGFDRGDCNSDGGFDVADPIHALGVVFNGDPATCLDACDANDDGQLNIADGVYILTTLFSQGPNPPPPHGVCGQDPTPDPIECQAFDGC